MYLSSLQGRGNQEGRGVLHVYEGYDRLESSGRGCSKGRGSQQQQ